MSTDTPQMYEKDSILRIFATHRVALIQSIIPIVGCQYYAEDVIHDAFIKTRASVDSANQIRCPIAYVFRIVRNLALDNVRRRNVEKRLGLDAEPNEQIESPEPMVEQSAIHANELSIVANALSELPGTCRTAFELHRLHGHTHQEIADRLGISASMVDKHIRKALTLCRLRLKQLEML